MRCATAASQGDLHQRAPGHVANVDRPLAGVPNSAVPVEEPQHLRRRIGAARVGVRADCAASEPGVPPPCTGHRSIITMPASPTWSSTGEPPTTGTAVRRSQLRARRAADGRGLRQLPTIFSALTGATVESLPPWITMSGTTPAGRGVPPFFIAAGAEPASCAEPYASPLCTPTAA